MKRVRLRGPRPQPIVQPADPVPDPIHPDLADTLATIRAIRGDGDPEILRLIAETQARKKGKPDDGS